MSLINAPVITRYSDAFATLYILEFDLTLFENNRNHKIGIYYEKDHNSLEIFYRDVRLSKGVLPMFYQPSNNITMFPMVLKSRASYLQNRIVELW